MGGSTCIDLEDAESPRWKRPKIEDRAARLEVISFVNIFHAAIGLRPWRCHWAFRGDPVRAGKT